MKDLDFYKKAQLTLLGITIVLLICVVKIFHNYSLNGRYHLTNEAKLIIDTRNGSVYSIYDNDEEYTIAVKINEKISKIEELNREASH